MIIPKYLGRFAAFLALLLPASLSARAPAPAHPALWAVSDADTTVYLFGTIHLLPKDLKWRSPSVDKAIDGADQLVVETIIDQKDPSKIMGAITSLGFTKGLPPLLERVPPAKRPALAEALKKSGFQPHSLDGMDTWAAAFLLLGTQFSDMALDQASGVEMVLRRQFEEKGKPIGELESNVEQLTYFDRLSEKSQRALLEGAIEDPRSVKQDFGGMLSAWSSGNVESIARSFNHDLAQSPELRKLLLDERNHHWRDWIEQRMATPGTVLVAVGAGHLAGNQSVIALLRQAGLKVRRVQ